MPSESGKVSISETTAWALKKMLSTSIEKKNWMRENKPEVASQERFQKAYQAELAAYKELEEALQP